MRVVILDVIDSLSVGSDKWGRALLGTSPTSIGGGNSLAQSSIGSADNGTYRFALHNHQHAESNASGAEYGLVKLSDAFNSESSSIEGIAATPKAVKDAYNKADDAYALASNKLDTVTLATSSSTSNQTASQSGSSFTLYYTSIPTKNSTSFFTAGGMYSYCGVSDARSTKARYLGGTSGIKYVDCLGIIESSTFNTKSDRRYKENIEIYDSGDKALPNVYRYNMKGSDRVKIGLVAQDLQQFDERLVSEGDNGMLGVDIYGVLSVLVDRVRKLEDKVR